jgi:hypothetical protein
MKKLIYSILALTLTISACKKDDDGNNKTTLPPLIVPSTYDSSSYTANTVNEKALLTEFKALVDEVKRSRSISNTVEFSTLIGLYSNLQLKTTSYYGALITSTGNGYLKQVAEASGKPYRPDSASTSGGVYGGYLFNADGLEPEQMIDKGLFGALHYNRACEILNGTLTAASVDQVLCLFGSNPSFPNSNDAAKHGHPDAYTAGYVARRDKNDGKGLYTAIKTNLITLQAAVKAGPLYSANQQQAIKELKLNWEKGNAATVINYLHSVISTLSGTNLTDAQKAGALHSYSEAVGFIHGWRTLGAQNKKMTDAQIDNLLTLLNAPATGTVNSKLFITDTFNQLPKLTQVINELKSIYNFTDAEVEDFKNNWVSIQGR